MKYKSIFISILFSICIIFSIFGQVPLVYDAENTGIGCTPPPLPVPDLLINYPNLPNPFAWADGSGVLTDFVDWECRRNEIKAEIEEYEIGPKPEPPANLTASYSNNTLTVEITDNDETITLTSNVIIPSGSGPFPVVIGMNNPTGSLPAELFEGVIQIPFMHNQVVTYTQTSDKFPDDPYYTLYPDLLYVGNYSAWSWGVSRLIDGIEIVQNELNAEMEHIAVTGCSYAGKMALFAGAYDERVALTIVQESGGGGINAWRVSETIGNVEKIDNTNYSWFMQSMKTNFQGQVGKLPHDHHELMAMIAPRALFVLGNPPFEWLGDESGYVSCRAAEEVYKAFDIADRFGFSFRSDHDHCQLPAESYPEVQAFVDKFLFGDTMANTDIHFHEFFGTDYQSWIEDWQSTANPNSPSPSITNPADGSTYLIPTTIEIEVEVSDLNDDVTKVEFYIGNNLLGEDTTAPYSFTWEDVSAGTHYIYVEASDTEGLTGYSNFVQVIVNSPSVDVYKIDMSPNINGYKDLVWNNPLIPTLEANIMLVGMGFSDEDLNGTAKMLWDDTNIYLLAEVIDDEKVNDSPAIYEDDNVEFYFDIDNSKLSSYDDNDVQYSFAWNDGTTIGVLPNGRPTTGIIYGIVDNANGYTVEAQIPWSTLQGAPQAGDEIGFEFMINDDDDGGGRDGKLSWNAGTDQAWQDASLFGTIKLLGDEIITDVDNLFENTVNIYPNPGTTVLHIDGFNNEFNYQILDNNGKVVLSGKAKKHIQTRDLQNGIYFFKIMNNKNRIVYKYIKQ